MAYDGNGTIYIPCEDFMVFLKKQAPDIFKDGAEYQFNLDDIRFRDGEIQIDYAFSTTEVHPMDWANPPEWIRKMQEKKKTG